MSTIKSLRRAAKSKTSFGRYIAEWLRRNDPHPVSWAGLTDELTDTDDRSESDE